MEKNISNTLHEIRDAFISYDDLEHLHNDVAIENLAKRFQQSIKDAKKNKCMFSVPCHIDLFSEGKKVSIIDNLISALHCLTWYDIHVTETGKSKLQPLWLEISNLVFQKVTM